MEKRKEDRVKELREILSETKSFYLCNFEGVKAPDFTELRNQAKREGVEIKVVKNRLALRVFEKGEDLEALKDFFRGPTALIFSKEDSISPARLIKKAQERVPIKVKGAYIEGEVFSGERFNFLATLPQKEVLYGKILFGLLSPVYGLTSLLTYKIRELLHILELKSKEGK